MPPKRTSSRGRKVFKKKRTFAAKSPARKYAKRTTRKVFKKRTFKRKVNGVVVARSTSVGAGNSVQNFLGSKSVPAGWWKRLMHDNVSSNYSGAHGVPVQVNQNVKTPFTVWKSLGTYEVQSALGYLASSSAVAAQTNTFKMYLHDMVRQHNWRNGSNGGLDLEFYVLQPRERIPATTFATPVATMPSIAPAGTNAYVGGYNGNLTMYQQTFTDQPAVPSGTKIGYNDLAATPFMSPAVAANFKIRPLSMRWPNGQRAFKGRLEAGQELTLTATRHKPLFISYNKYGLTAASNYAIQNVWQCLRETPLIFVYVSGTTSHEANSFAGPIQPGIGLLDYRCTTHFKTLMSQVATPATSKYTLAPAALAAPAQTLPVTGAQITEV